MRVVFAGTPEPAATALAAVLDSDHEVVGVITRPDTVAGRGRRVTRSPVGVLADEHGIEVFTPSSLRSVEAHEKLTQWAPECVPVVAYGGLVPESLLAVPDHGWVNLHFSLLPAHRGAAPVQAAIASGDDVTGASTFRIDEGLDTGPVFGVVTETVEPSDTAGELLGRLASSGARLLVSTLDALAAGTIAAVPQDHSIATMAPKISVDDARVRWDLPAHVVDRQVRAHTPAPGAWTLWDGARIKIGPIGAIRQTSGGDQPGTVRATKKEVTVATGSGEVVLGTVQPPGKKPMNAADWARGARIGDDAAVVFG